MNNLKKAAVLVVTALVMMLAVAGCAKDEKGTSETSEASSSAVAVKNALGEDVEIKSSPKRVVALPVWAAEMAIDLAGTDRIVAVSPWIDDSDVSPLYEKAQEIKERVQSKDAEKILALQPDLVLLDTFNDYDGSLSATLKEAGITVLTLASPVSFEEIADRLDTLSKALFVPEKGQQIIKEMNQRLDAVKQKVEGVEQKVKVLFYEDQYSSDGKSTGMLSAYGKGSTFDAIAQAAGVINVCTAENYSPVSRETVVNEWKPDLIVVPGIWYDGKSSVNDKGAGLIEAIKKDSMLRTLPAIQNNRIIALTEKYRGSTTHYMAYAVEELAKACYPDLFN
ncbi:MAG TPA: ABC transporter substrate-binding protein [Clostridiales bacterium]|nr:ABC transporter substrate-binding protein [Clostridiales bacterium]